MVRGKKALKIPKGGLKIKQHALLQKYFREMGNFGFDISKYIHIDSKIRYDPITGIYKMAFLLCLTLVATVETVVCGLPTHN